MMFLMGIVTVMCVMQFLSFTQFGIYMAIIGGFASGYILEVLHSLHNKFKQESEIGSEAP